jgi:hypothetical protein
MGLFATAHGVHSVDAAPAPTDPCSHWYPGRRAFEAPETNNLANFVESLPGLVAFIDLRSYGQMGKDLRFCSI